MAESKKKLTYICCHCKRELPIAKSFYRTSSPIFSGTKRLPICKECFEELYNAFVVKYHNEYDAMHRMCMAFDLYYDEELLKKCFEENNGLLQIGNYIKRLNMIQYKRKTYDNSLDEGALFMDYMTSLKTNKPDPRGGQANEDESNVNSSKDKDKKDISENIPAKRRSNAVKQRDISFWGSGFEPLDYEVLNNHYKYLKNANPNCDSNQEIFIKDLCYINMQKMRALRTDDIDNYNKLTESYRKSFKQANLSASDENKADNDSWGWWVYQVSQYTPEEVYKDKDRYKDHDGLGEYYERFAVRPLKNIVLGTKERDKKQYVHEE